MEQSLNTSSTIVTELAALNVRSKDQLPVSAQINFCPVLLVSTCNKTVLEAKQVNH